MIESLVAMVRKMNFDLLRCVYVYMFSVLIIILFG